MATKPAPPRLKMTTDDLKKMKATSFSCNMLAKSYLNHTHKNQSLKQKRKKENLACTPPPWILLHHRGLHRMVRDALQVTNMLQQGATTELGT